MLNRLRVQIASGFAAHGLSAAANLATLPVYFAYLGADAVGLVGFLGSLQVLATLTDFGLGPVLNRELARASTDDRAALPVGLLKAVEIAYLAATLLVGAVIWSGAPWLADHWLPPSVLDRGVVIRTIRLGGVAIATQFLAMLYITSLRGLGLHVLANTWHAVGQLLRLLGAVAVVVLLWTSVEAVLAWQAGIGGTVVLVLRRLLWGRVGAGWSSVAADWAALRARGAFAAELTVVLATWPLISQIDKLVVSNTLGLGPLGFYVTAGTAATAVTLVTLPISNVFTPLLSRLASGERHHLADAYHLAAQATTVATSAVAVTLVMMPRLVLQAWTASEAVACSAGVSLQILAFGALVNSLIVVPFALQVAVGWVRVVRLTNLVLVVVLAPALWAMTARYGLAGAACGWPLLNLVHVAAQAWAVERRILPHEWARWLARDVLLPVVGAVLVIAVVAAAAARTVGPETGRLAALALLGTAVGGGLIGSTLLARDVRSRLLGQ
jgi:O-antigen/teichoic acid export membrane protein